MSDCDCCRVPATTQCDCGAHLCGECVENTDLPNGEILLLCERCADAYLAQLSLVREAVRWGDLEKAQRALAAFYQMLEPAVEEWHDVSETPTAPGLYLVVVDRRPCVAEYIGDHQVPDECFADAEWGSVYDPDEDCWYCPAGWYLDAEGRCELAMTTGVTHWRPLPAMPEVTHE